MIIVFVGLAFFAKISTVSSARTPIVQGLSNVAVVAGKNVSLSCKPDSTNISVTWYQIPVHSKGTPSPQIRLINNGFVPFRNFSEYSFGGSAPGEVLFLNYTRLSHAGLYLCTAGGQQATAQLIVLAWEPNCSFTFDRSLLYLSCIVKYNGDWIPSMQWLETTANGTESRTISESNCSKPSKNVESFNHSARFHIESVYVFKLNFANRNCVKTNSTAANIPDYEYTWKLKNTQIFYGPENVIVHPKKDVYSSSDDLSCSSDSYPNSDFKWAEKKIGDVQSGAILSLKNFSFRNEPYVLSCLAINVLTNITASSEPYNVHIGIDESTTKVLKMSSNGNIAKVTIGSAEKTGHRLSMNGLATYGLMAMKPRVTPDPMGSEPADHMNLTVLSITLTGVPLLLIGFVVLIACIVVAKRRKGSAKKTATVTELKGAPTSTHVTTLGADGSTVTAHSSYQGIDLNHLKAELPTRARDDASTNVENIDSNSAGGVSIGKVSDDSGSDSNSSRKRSRYEALLERSPMAKRIYLSLKKTQQREQDTQTSDSSSLSVAIMSESPVYVNSMQATVTK